MLVEEMSAPGGAAFSPDSRRLAIGHADGSIRLYELPSGRQVKQLEGVSSHGRMAFHPKGRQLAVSCATGIKVYDLETGRILADLRQPAETSSFAWHPDGKTLAAACDDSRIYLWDVALGKRTHVLEGCRGTGHRDRLQPCRRSARQRRLGRRPAAVGPADGHATLQHAILGDCGL